MYPSVTSDKAILQASRTLLQEQGWTALNIRSVAAACGVSVGSIYNRFGSKSQLVAATVESTWQEIFCLPQDPGAFADLLSCVAWLFQRLAESRQTGPRLFSLHYCSLCFSREELDAGQRRMERSWAHIKQFLLAVLAQDPQVRPGTFHEGFSAEDFVDLLFSLLLAALLRKDAPCAPILALIRRTIY
ncbi:MAG: TetR/AcrR family transcriptional regulator [Evtepia gabavorous]